jgi:hypothetical protein
MSYLGSNGAYQLTQAAWLSVACRGKIPLLTKVTVSTRHAERQVRIVVVVLGTRSGVSTVFKGLDASCWYAVRTIMLDIQTQGVTPCWSDILDYMLCS